MIEHYSATDLIVGFFGLYLAAVSAAALMRRQMFAAIMADLREAAGLRYLAGVVAFALGALLVSVHALWSTPLQIVASLIGWLALAEGVLLIVAGRSVLRVGEPLRLHPRPIRIAMIGFLALGVLLAGLGFLPPAAR